MIVAWLMLWPLWVALLAVPLILMSPGCGCCGVCPCVGAKPRAWIITLSDSSEGPVSVQFVSGCQWQRTFGAVDWTLTIDASVMRITRIDTTPNPDLTTIWEADISSYGEVDCCVDLEDLELTCISSDEDFCTDGVTLTVRSVCTDLDDDECMCGDTTPTTLRVTLSGFSTSSWNGVYFVPFDSRAGTSCYWKLGVTGSTPYIEVQHAIALPTGRVYVTTVDHGDISPGPEGDGFHDYQCLSWWGIADILFMGLYHQGYAEVEAA